MGEQPKADIIKSPPELDDMVIEQYLLDTFGVTPRTIRRWVKEGWIKRYYYPWLKKPMYNKREIQKRAVMEGKPTRPDQFEKKG